MGKCIDSTRYFWNYCYSQVCFWLLPPLTFKTNIYYLLSFSTWQLFRICKAPHSFLVYHALCGNSSRGKKNNLENWLVLTGRYWFNPVSRWVDLLILSQTPNIWAKTLSFLHLLTWHVLLTLVCLRDNRGLEFGVSLLHGVGLRNPAGQDFLTGFTLLLSQLCWSLGSPSLTFTDKDTEVQRSHTACLSCLRVSS